MINSRNLIYTNILDLTQLATLEALQKAEQQAKAQAEANGYQIVNGQVVNDQGTPVAGWMVKNGVAYDANGNSINVPTATDKQSPSLTGVTKETISQYPTRKAYKQSLPQTGNASETGAILAGLSMLAGTLAMALGFKKKEN